MTETEELSSQTNLAVSSGLKRSKGNFGGGSTSRHSEFESPEQADKLWQGSILKAVKSRFEPQAVLMNKFKRFDQIDMFVINGTKFEQIR